MRKNRSVRAISWRRPAARLAGAAILAAVFSAASAVPALAGDITRIKLRITGEVNTGESADAMPLEVTASSSRYYVDDCYFANGVVVWDRRDTPRLAVCLYPESGERFKRKAAETATVEGIRAEYVTGEWLDNDDGASGMCLYFDLDPVSKPGASALKRMQEIEEKYAGARNTARVREARARETADGWYEDCNGWWYLLPDRTYPIARWMELEGSWYYFDENGYMATGWRQVDGKWYYLDENGVMQIGWIQVDGKNYYLDGSGAMLSDAAAPDGRRLGAEGAEILE